MKILFIEVPDTTVIDEANPLPFVTRAHNWIGIPSAGNRLLQVLTPDSFSVQGEDVDENGDPIPPTTLPVGWTILGAYRFQNNGRTIYANDVREQRTVPAADITDTVINRSQRYARYYVRARYDNQDPPQITGVILFTRTGQQIIQDNTDPDNPVYDIPGAVPASDGSYTKQWTEPGKDTGVGIVTPDQLNPDGSYTYDVIDRKIDRPAYATILRMPRAATRKYWPNVDDIGTRPMANRDLLAYSARNKPLFNRIVTDIFSEEFH